MGVRVRPLIRRRDLGVERVIGKWVGWSIRTVKLEDYRKKGSRTGVEVVGVYIRLFGNKGRP